MSTSRSYGDACAIARALDVIGERWALLIVRELLLAPQRFSDLRHSLSGASSNLITDRVRELEARGVLHRYKLPPPAASWVYDLTDWGRELEPIVLSLGAWAMHVPLPPDPTLSATSVLLYLRGSARPEGPPATLRIDLDDRPWTIRTATGRLQIDPAAPANPDASLATDPPTLNSLLEDPASLDTVLSTGAATVTGDLSAIRHLLQQCS
jgi:DNA-binding HxlR family transcriptional regulator